MKKRYMEPTVHVVHFQNGIFLMESPTATSEDPPNEQNANEIMIGGDPTKPPTDDSLTDKKSDTSEGNEAPLDDNGEPGEEGNPADTTTGAETITSSESIQVGPPADDVVPPDPVPESADTQLLDSSQPTNGESVSEEGVE